MDDTVSYWRCWTGVTNMLCCFPAVSRPLDSRGEGRRGVVITGSSRASRAHHASCAVRGVVTMKTSARCVVEDAHRVHTTCSAAEVRTSLHGSKSPYPASSTASDPSSRSPFYGAELQFSRVSPI
ncbi:hypothetical protein RRG08_057397 [Elysia crispata]|uniref:Uncharacterized protein n=1 Tax=Elysia crispata TaxID=231223 RepID=A0AAE1B236_9GAST|nr:hypothetical protein RRG08_057397 [Elysia crispata]